MRTTPSAIQAAAVAHLQCHELDRRGARQSSIRIPAESQEQDATVGRSQSRDSPQAGRANC